MYMKRVVRNIKDVINNIFIFFTKLVHACNRQTSADEVFILSFIWRTRGVSEEYTQVYSLIIYVKKASTRGSIPPDKCLRKRAQSQTSCKNNSASQIETFWGSKLTFFLRQKIFFSTTDVRFEVTTRMFFPNVIMNDTNCTDSNIVRSNDTKSADLNIFLSIA